MKICEEIRKVKNGYIVVIRHPYGDAAPYGEVVCNTFNQVVELLKQASLEES